MLPGFAVRLIFQQAVLGRTLAGSRVHNSPMDPLAGLLDVNTAWSPAIAVFSGVTKGDAKGMDMNGAAATATLCANIYVPPSAVLTTEEGETLKLEGRGTLATFALDMIASQCFQALVLPESPWAALWPKFATSIKTWTVSPPFLEVDKGARVPACSIEIEYAPVPNPIPGRPMTDRWQALYNIMAAEPTLLPLADMIKNSIERLDWVPDWSRIIMQLGISSTAALNAGIRPLQVDAPHQVSEELGQIGTYEEDVDDGGPLVQ